MLGDGCRKQMMGLIFDYQLCCLLHKLSMGLLLMDPIWTHTRTFVLAAVRRQTFDALTNPAQCGPVDSDV